MLVVYLACKLIGRDDPIWFEPIYLNKQLLLQASCLLSSWDTTILSIAAACWPIKPTTTKAKNSMANEQIVAQLRKQITVT